MLARYVWMVALKLGKQEICNKDLNFSDVLTKCHQALCVCMRSAEVGEGEEGKGKSGPNPSLS